MDSRERPMDKVLVTTTAYAWLGRVERECERYLHLADASRVFNDGRFGAFVREGRHDNAAIECVGPARVRIPHHHARRRRRSRSAFA